MTKEVSINITEEMATWPVKDIIRLLTTLESEGYTETIFDGYNGAIYLVKEDVS